MIKYYLNYDWNKTGICIHSDFEMINELHNVFNNFPIENVKNESINYFNICIETINQKYILTYNKSIIVFDNIYESLIYCSDVLNDFKGDYVFLHSVLK